MSTVVKATTKGQITLPMKWRKNFNTNQYVIREKGGVLEITPIDLAKLESTNEYTVFDAIRDNNGKGIRAKELGKILRKTLK